MLADPFFPLGGEVVHILVAAAFGAHDLVLGERVKTGEAGHRVRCDRPGYAASPEREENPEHQSGCEHRKCGDDRRGQGLKGGTGGDDNTLKDNVDRECDHRQVDRVELPGLVFERAGMAAFDGGAGRWHAAECNGVVSASVAAGWDRGRAVPSPRRGEMRVACLGPWVALRSTRGYGPTPRWGWWWAGVAGVWYAEGCVVCMAPVGWGDGLEARPTGEYLRHGLRDRLRHPGGPTVGNGFDYWGASLGQRGVCLRQ